MDGPWNDFKPQAAQAGPWDDFKKPEDVSTAADIAKSGGIGVVKGGLGLAGSLGDLTDLGAKGIEHASNYLSDKLGIARYERPSAPSVLNNIPTSASLQNNVEGVTGKFYEPKTTAGQYAQTAGEFTPALLGGGEGLLSKIATRVAAPALASETAGQITKGTDVEPYARVAGSLLSPTMLNLGRRVITPLPATAERTNLANTLRGEGVDLTAGQATGSKPLQWAESTFGDMPGAGGRAGQMMTDQGEQFTNAALRRVGEDAPRATPDVIDNAFNRIGGQFQQIGSRNHLVPDQQLVNDLGAVRDNYNRVVGPSARAPAVQDTIADITHQVRGNGGVLAGDQYNALASQLGSDARAARNDPYLQRALQGHKDALDDAFERSLQASGNTQDLNALREARNQYRNLMVVEKAATGAGSNAAEGLISPSSLRNAVVQQNRRSYARGQGDFADLARSGEALLKPLPQSGTAPRLNMQHALQTLGTVIGGAAGSAGGPAGAAAGAMTGIAAPAAAGRLLMSRPVQSYLGNQALLPGAGDTSTRALARALMASTPSRIGDIPRVYIDTRDAEKRSGQRP